MPSVIKSILPEPVLRWLHAAGLYKNFAPAPGKVQWGQFRRTKPFNENFGIDRGGAIDRYYIERFLHDQANCIRGRVLEVGDNEYTMRFGSGRVAQSDILHVTDSNSKATIIGDLSHAPQIADNSFDCIILTQTLQMIYDFRAALETCFRILKPGASLLLTVPGLSPIDHGEWKYTWLWSFNELSVQKLLGEHFDAAGTAIRVDGNVAVASAFLYGLGLPDVPVDMLDYTDPHYPVIISAKATKGC